MKAEKQVIHFWVPYPEKAAPSQRFRVELFLPYLNENGFDFEQLSFLDEKGWHILYKPGKGFQRAISTLKGFFRRFKHLLKSRRANYIFLHREAAPVGPPIFEWLLAKVFRKKIIHEYDDAIWIPGGEPVSVFKKLLKASWKVKYIIKWSYKIAAGNEFLCNYARQYNSSVFYVPTVVDTKLGHNKLRNQTEGNRIVIGWTGTHTTLHNLDIIEDVIQELKKEFDFEMLIISNKPPAWSFDFTFKKWDSQTEIDDLLKMHIGIMPLKEGPWFEGKCGFKLIQYHACGIPAVASPVGVNPVITLHEKTGFIARNKEEWKKYLGMLIRDLALRTNMGLEGRHYIEERFSLDCCLPLFLSLFS